jgi:hypothetical protein
MAATPYEVVRNASRRASAKKKPRRAEDGDSNVNNRNRLSAKRSPKDFESHDRRARGFIQAIDDQGEAPKFLYPAARTYFSPEPSLAVPI